jgi:transposase InsO family protein
MKDLYSVAGLSKQALWKYKDRQRHTQVVITQMVKVMKQIRKNHKRMGSRSMYYTWKEALPVGRDIFEQIGLDNGFRVKRKRNVHKTTRSQLIEVYPNLIEGRKLNGINQVWQSDMFYLKVEGRDYYGITIMDVYSRKLLALHISKSLSALALEKAMKKALKARTGHKLKGCIFHSDRGGQYISKIHKELLKKQDMKISMCLLPQENAYVESIQGTLKEYYLEVMDLREKNLQYMVRKIIYLYNHEKPHSELGMKTPDAYEQDVLKLPENLRPELTIYQWDHEKLTKSQVANKKKKEAKKKKSI